MLFGVLDLKTKLKFLAAETRAPSSGDWAWYSKTPEKKFSKNQIYI